MVKDKEEKISITEKICNTCNENKLISEYPKNGIYTRAMCKVCKNKEKQKWLNTKESNIYNPTQLKMCSACNKEKNSKEFHKSKDGLYGVKSVCKNCKKGQAHDHYKDNRETYLENKKEYYKDNKELVVNRVVEYRKNKLETDPFFKMKENIRCLIRNAFTRQYSKKSTKTIEILGCTFDEFKTHLEKQFTPEMNWDNQGSYWHIDHIKPISLASTKEEIIRLNHYTNFQPLYWKDNLEKENQY